MLAELKINFCKFLYKCCDEEGRHSQVVQAQSPPSCSLDGEHSGGLRNVRTVRSHRPPLKEKTTLKKIIVLTVKKSFFI